MMSYCCLPPHCRLQILSYLNVLERGIAAQVCREWRDVIITPNFWTHLDLRPFISSRDDDAVVMRMYSFISFVVKLKPVLCSLHFTLNTADFHILQGLEYLITRVDCSKLLCVCAFWKCNHEEYNSYRSVVDNKRLAIYNQELCFCFEERLHRYQRFLSCLITQAPNMEVLRLHWNWSLDVFPQLVHLAKIRTLEIQNLKIQNPDLQPRLIKMILTPPTLEYLILNADFSQEDGDSGLVYFISKSLQYLDISLCRALRVHCLDLPSLYHIVISKGSVIFNAVLYQLGQGPFYNVVPCWYDLLRQGCPSLLQINKFMLASNWKNSADEQLEIVLRSFCSCTKHV